MVHQFIFNPLFEDKETQEISTFGEAPAAPTKVKDLEDAEKQTEQRDEEDLKSEKEHNDQEDEKVEEYHEEAGDKTEAGGADLGGDMDDLDTEGGEATSEDENDDKYLDEANEKSDEELSQMNYLQLYHTRFIPKCDYDTPGGISTIGSGNCPGCSDAGDAAIIDAEVSPSQGSDQIELDGKGNPVEEEGGGDLGDMGDMGEDLDMTMELHEFVSALHKMQAYDNDRFRREVMGTEGLLEFAQGLFGIVKTILIKTFKYGRRVFKFTRDKAYKTFLRLQTIQKLWYFKLSGNLDKVDEERLAEYEVEAYPYDVWIDAAKLALNCFDIVSSSKNMLFDKGTEVMTGTMKHIDEALKARGIEINPAKNRVVFDELLDNRRFASVTELGYVKSQIPNVLRYFNDIARRVPKGSDNHIENIGNILAKEVTSYAARFSQAVDEGRISKDSEEYRTESTRVVQITTRLDYVLSLMKVAYTLFDQLSSDALKVFRKYEDSMTLKSLV